MRDVLSPGDLAIPASGMFTGTLGKAEPETVVCVFALFHKRRGLREWAPVTLGDFVDFTKSDPTVTQWLENPFWLLNLVHGARIVGERGLIEGWVNGEPDSVGTISPKCLAALAGSHWDRRGGVAGAALAEAAAGSTCPAAT